MSMTCSVCRHADCTDIEIAVVRGVPYRDIADRYDLSRSAVARHAQVHLPEMLAKSEDAREIASADTVLGQIEGLRDAALSILQRAELSQDSETSLKAIREARGCVELLARVIGELKDGSTTVNVLVMPEWVQIQTIVLNALADHPQARVAVASALKQLEAPTDVQAA